MQGYGVTTLLGWVCIVILTAVMRANGRDARSFLIGAMASFGLIPLIVIVKRFRTAGRAAFSDTDHDIDFALTFAVALLSLCTLALAWIFM